MKNNVLINYNFSKSSNDAKHLISGTDQRNLWCYLIIKKLRNIGYEVLFPNDFNTKTVKNVDLEIHINFSQKRSNAKWNIGLFMETPEIEPMNHLSSCAAYDIVISHNPDLYNAPNHVVSVLPCWDVEALPETTQPKELYCSNTFSMIAANKNFKNPVKYKDLYKERIRMIEYFEYFYSKQFKLYGPGWNVRKELLSFPRLQKVAQKFRIPGNLKSYQGVCVSKNDVIRNSTFNICFENCVYPGYLSEKVFDAILGGSIPIYWGHHEIPQTLKASIIDASQFESLKDLIQYCYALSIEERLEIVKNGSNFLQSDGLRYSHQEYANQVTRHVEQLLLAQ